MTIRFENLIALQSLLVKSTKLVRFDYATDLKIVLIGSY